MNGGRQNRDGINVKRMTRLGVAHGIAQLSDFADQQIAGAVGQPNGEEICGIVSAVDEIRHGVKFAGIVVNLGLRPTSALLRCY